MKYRVQLAPSSAEAFAANPYWGKELQGDLVEFRSYRIKRYRVVFKVVDKEKNLKVFAIGHRREVYDLQSDIYLLVDLEKGCTLFDLGGILVRI